MHTTSLPINEIARLYKDEGLSIMAIAKRFRVSYTTIWRVMVSNGIEIRSKLEAVSLAGKKERPETTKEILVNGPPYLIYVCPSCVNLRHFRPKGSNIYYCPVCKLEVYYTDGKITRKLDGRGIKG